MTSQDLLARLRGHVQDCCQAPWPGRCRPETGIYCSVGRPMYDAFAVWRRAEVMAAHEERLAAARVLGAEMVEAGRA